MQCVIVANKLKFVKLICQREVTSDESSYDPSPFDSIHSSSVVEPPQLKMNVDTGMQCCVFQPWY